MSALAPVTVSVGALIPLTVRVVSAISVSVVLSEKVLFRRQSRYSVAASASAGAALMVSAVPVASAKSP